jgi:hypothetical protein
VPGPAEQRKRKKAAMPLFVGETAEAPGKRQERFTKVKFR